jgi:heme-degrading monooxygenase HmoA
MFVRHTVKEFSAWKAEYDAFESERKKMGVTSHGVYQSDQDPNDVTLYHRFDTVEAAKAFAGSDTLKEAMQRAGVVGDPDIWFTKEA